MTNDLIKPFPSAEEIVFKAALEVCNSPREGCCDDRNTNHTKWCAACLAREWIRLHGTSGTTKTK